MPLAGPCSELIVIPVEDDVLPSVAVLGKIP
jgi:hypothetical protein